MLEASPPSVFNRVPGKVDGTPSRGTELVRCWLCVCKVGCRNAGSYHVWRIANKHTWSITEIVANEPTWLTNLCATTIGTTYKNLQRPRTNRLMNRFVNQTTIWIQKDFDHPAQNQTVFPVLHLTPLEQMYVGGGVRSCAWGLIYTLLEGF